MSSMTHPELTLRETQVALGISEGKTYPEVAKALGLEYETVRSYVNRLREKTGHRRKPLLTVWAVQEKPWLNRQIRSFEKESASCAKAGTSSRTRPGGTRTAAASRKARAGAISP